MVKFMIGVGFSALLLFGLVIMPYFIEYPYRSEMWFGINNTFFLLGGFLLGNLFFREFFTDEIEEKKIDIPPTPTFSKLDKGLRPQDFIIENDSLGGRNVN